LKELLSVSEFGILGWAGFLGEVILSGIRIWRIFGMSRIFFLSGIRILRIWGWAGFFDDYMQDFLPVGDQDLGILG